jgi:hypothetical protein
MAFSIPDEVVNFFNRHPDALPVFALEGGQTFINHYQNQAFDKAVMEQNRLYSIDKNLNVLQVYPSMYTYVGVIKHPALEVKCKSSVVVLPSGSMADLSNAINAAAAAAGVNITSVSITDGGATWTVSLVSEQANWSIKQSDSGVIVLTQN